MDQPINALADAKADVVQNISEYVSDLSRHFNAGNFGCAHFNARRVASTCCSWALGLDRPSTLMLVKLAHCIDDMLLYAKPTPDYIAAMRPVIDAMEAEVAALERDI